MIKSEIQFCGKVEKINFPKLMVAITAGNIVVLMTEPGKGTVLRKSDYSGSVQPIGRYFDCWNMSQFEDFKGEVVLKNECE